MNIKHSFKEIVNKPYDLTIQAIILEIRDIIFSKGACNSKTSIH